MTSFLSIRSGVQLLPLVLAFISCDGGRCSPSRGGDESRETSRVAPEATSAEESVNRRTYVRCRAEGAKLDIRLRRPAKRDAAVLLCVAGTYTSADDRVEGVVVSDGEVIRREAKSWEGALVIVDGVPRIDRVEGGRVSDERIERISQQRGSLIQGHLLVHDSTAQSFINAPALPRRALVMNADGFAIIESRDSVGLGDFAGDLQALGARAAMNLDMGAWSEGWVREAGGNGVLILGDPSESTKRQTNWLVFRG